MKSLFLFIIIIFSFLLTACHYYTISENPVSFHTPFGYINKGDSMSEVMQVLGNPHHVSSYKRKELWEYEFADKLDILVYFDKGNVAEVKLINDFQEQ